VDRRRRARVFLVYGRDEAALAAVIETLTPEGWVQDTSRYAARRDLTPSAG
jgi:hypothetical protein